jgi:radical SAM protein with 4Fe4S-binding SPASM domain
MKRTAVPIEIIVEITGKCKLVCDYCTDSRRPHVPLNTIIKVLDDAANFGVKAVRITGGEPLLHPDLATILNYAKSKKFQILLNTAAEDISPTLMQAITKNVDVALISLQGYSAQRNANYTRSRASFTDKIKNIFFLKSQLPQVWLATVITPTMATAFTQFLPLIKKINPAIWMLLRPISDMNDELKTMDIAFYRALTLNIMKTRRDGINVFIGNPIPMCLAGDLRIGKQAFFGANLDDGHVRLVYSAQGFFKPSYFLDTNLGDTLKKAWAHPFLKELDRTDYLPNLCQQCPVLQTCRGGCRAMALRTRGNPFCARPAV